MTTNRLDFVDVLLLIREAVDNLNTLHGNEWDDSGKNDTNRAATAKQLNYTADLLIMAASHVRNEYWIGKGFTDPLSK